MQIGGRCHHRGRCRSSANRRFYRLAARAACPQHLEDLLERFTSIAFDRTQRVGGSFIPMFSENHLAGRSEAHQDFFLILPPALHRPLLMR